MHVFRNAQEGLEADWSIWWWVHVDCLSILWVEWMLYFTNLGLTLHLKMAMRVRIFSSFKDCINPVVQVQLGTYPHVADILHAFASIRFSSFRAAFPCLRGSEVTSHRHAEFECFFFFAVRSAKVGKTMEKCIDPPWTRQLRYIVKPALLTKARKSWSINIQPSGSTWSKDSKVGDNMRWWAELRVKTGAFHDSLNQPPPTLQSFRKP